MTERQKQALATPRHRCRVLYPNTHAIVKVYFGGDIYIKMVAPSDLTALLHH
jgi:hypothetical protein